MAGIVFLLLFLVGSFLSIQKPLWNDEIYTQAHSLEQFTYIEIALAKPVESNNCPLFYLIQKSISQLFNVHLDAKWMGERVYTDIYAQWVLRLQSNIFMSLAIALIFLYFSRYYSLTTGIFSLVVSLSSMMVWMYWAEARPYSLWFFLTVVQSIIFLTILNQAKVSAKSWRLLTIMHVLLSFTVIISVAQIFIVSCILWFVKERHVKRYIVTSIIPMGIGLSYYLSAYITWYQLINPLQLIYINFPIERMLIIFLYMLMVLFYIQDKGHLLFFIKKGKNYHQQHLPYYVSTGYFVFTICMVVVALLILGYVSLKSNPDLAQMSLDNRYFIFLTPISIISTVLFANLICHSLPKGSWGYINAVLFILGVVFVRLGYTIIDLLQMGIY